MEIFLIPSSWVNSPRKDTVTEKIDWRKASQEKFKVLTASLFLCAKNAISTKFKKLGKKIFVFSQDVLNVAKSLDFLKI